MACWLRGSNYVVWVFAKGLLRTAPPRIDGKVKVGRVQSDATSIAGRRPRVVRCVGRCVQEAIMKTTRLRAERSSYFVKESLGPRSS